LPTLSVADGITTAGLNSIKCLLQGVTAKLMTTLYAQGKAEGIPWLPFAACAAFNVIGVFCALGVRDMPAEDETAKSINTEHESTPLLSGEKA
jgi:hypothetical protein